MIACYFSSLVNGRTLKVLYEFEDDGEGNYHDLNPNRIKFQSFIMHKLWRDWGTTGYLHFLQLLEFPDCQQYPTHYTIETSKEEYYEFIDNMKATSNDDF